MNEDSPLYPPSAKDIARQRYIFDFMESFRHNCRDDIYLLNVECELEFMLRNWEKKLKDFEQ